MKGALSGSNPIEPDLRIDCRLSEMIRTGYIKVMNLELSNENSNDVGE